MSVIGRCLLSMYSFYVYFWSYLPTTTNCKVNTIGATSPFIMKNNAFPNAVVAVGTTNASKDFRLEELELIFEMLCDVLSDTTILPSLFVSFDCHPTSVDIVRPLVNHICRCSRWLFMMMVMVMVMMRLFYTFEFSWFVYSHFKQTASSSSSLISPLSSIFIFFIV